MKHLYRSEKNRMIAGVAGGIAEYFQIDPTIVRIVFLLLFLAYGVALPVYIVSWIIIPKKSSLKKKSDEYVKENTQELKDTSQKLVKDLKINDKQPSTGFALIMIIFGLFLLARNFGLFDWIEIGKLWPLLLVAFGVIHLIRR